MITFLDALAHLLAGCALLFLTVAVTGDGAHGVWRMICTLAALTAGVWVVFTAASSMFSVFI